MILREVLKIVIGFLKAVFSIMPNIPQLPTEISSVMNWFISTISSVIGFINAIFPLSLAVNLITFVLVVKNVRLVKNTMLWFVRKIPFLGIK